MVAEYWALWRTSIRLARGEGVWWRSPFVWALIATVGAVVSYALADGAIISALATPLFFAAGLLWMGVMVQLALRGPDALAGFVLGVVVLAIAMRIGLAAARYLLFL
ncbi:hypothetical protein [Endothiovibrio diazotrophicus]